MGSGKRFFGVTKLRKVMGPQPSIGDKKTRQTFDLPRDHGAQRRFLVRPVPDLAKGNVRDAVAHLNGVAQHMGHLVGGTGVLFEIRADIDRIPAGAVKNTTVCLPLRAAGLCHIGNAAHLGHVRPDPVGAVPNSFGWCRGDLRGRVVARLRRGGTSGSQQNESDNPFHGTFLMQARTLRQDLLHRPSCAVAPNLKPKRMKQSNPTLLAGLWMIGAIVSFTSMAIAGRAVSFELDTFEIMLFRSLTGILIVAVVASAAGKLKQVNTRQLPLHGIRNLAHFTGQNLWFFAITAIPLAQVFALEFTTPIWVILLSPLLLGEKITRTGALAAAMGFAGVLFVAQPGRTEISPGLIAAALAAGGFALSAIFTRKLTRTQPITCILFWLTVMQAVFGLIAAGFDGDIALPSATTAPWLVLIGCAGLLAHFCLTTALSLAPAGVVMPIDFVRLPVIAFVAAALYQEPLDPWVFLGAAVIFAANYLNITRGQRAVTQM